jgi:hypothetical protein
LQERRKQVGQTLNGSNSTYEKAMAARTGVEPVYQP